MKKEEKLKVYLVIPPVGDCGVGYYRQWLPLTKAKEKGEIELVCQHFTWGERGDETGKEPPTITEDDTYKYGEWADVIFFSRNDVPGYIAQAGGMKEFFNKSVILDVDDNVQATRPFNPGYRSFHPNSPNMTWNIKSFGVYDGFIFSTQDLIDYYKKYGDKKKFYIYPNSLDFKRRDAVLEMDFSKSKLFKKKEGEIRIGWTGSSSHWENLKHIEKPLLDILRKYPNTTFYYSGLFGELFNDEKLIKDKRIVKIPWSSLKEWAKVNREMNFDIALAPLTDNYFNRSKSNLRVLEYASAKYPVICSNVAPYRCFKDNKEVIFATEKEEWYNAIEMLVNNPEKRQELANNLYNRAKKDYDVDKNYKILVKALKNIKKNFTSIKK